MRIRTLILSLIVGLGILGSGCINEEILIVADLLLEECFAIKPGPDLSYDRSHTLTIEDELDEAIEEDLSDARFYDIRVKVQGTYSGSVSGVARINGIDLLQYQGQWSDFQTPQSLLGTSPYITPVQAGVIELVNVLLSLPLPGPTVVILSSTGSLSGESPVPSGLSVCVEILGQVDATMTTE